MVCPMGDASCHATIPVSRNGSGKVSCLKWTGSSARAIKLTRPKKKYKKKKESRKKKEMKIEKTQEKNRKMGGRASEAQTNQLELNELGQLGFR